MAKKVTKKRTFKTKKKLSKSRTVYRKWAEWDEGDVLTAELVSMEIDSTYEKPQFVVKVIEASWTKKLDGKLLTLNSAGFLNNALLDKNEELKVDIGEVIQVEYTGLSEMAKGKFKGKDAHTGVVELMTDEDEEDEDIDDEDEDEDDESDDEDEDDEDEDEDEDENDDTEGYDL